jgi:hypothetical protein
MHIYESGLLSYMSSSVYAHIRKSTYVYVHLWKEAFVNVHIRKCFHICAYMESGFCTFVMCAYTKADFCICMLPYMCIYGSQLLNMCSSIYAHIHKLNSVYACFHICAFIEVTAFHKCTYTKVDFRTCAYMEGGHSHISAFTEGNFHKYMYTEVGFHICMIPYMHIYGS